MEAMMAIFVPLRGDELEIRAAVCAAALADAPAQRCVIGAQIDYYPGQLARLLEDEEMLREELESMRADASGERNGCARCVLLTSVDAHAGVLIHWNGAWQASSFPVIDARQAARERRAFAQLAEIARELSDVPLLLRRGLAPGRTAWGKAIGALMSEGDAQER